VSTSVLVDKLTKYPLKYALKLKIPKPLVQMEILGRFEYKVKEYRRK
jgi:hypothetical protein